MRKPSLTLFRLKQKQHLVELIFEETEIFTLSCYQLRIHSPSAEMRAHGAVKPSSNKASLEDSQPLDSPQLNSQNNLNEIEQTCLHTTNKHKKPICNKPENLHKQPMVEQVNICNIEPIGNYAIKIKFDDGHQTGIYDWNYLYTLCQKYGNKVK